ncbi:hypothetical protein M0R72_04630 [Candidatus Pacearchaeota archaeon]|jgi:hypothetical protein|nr:hypothetical protein [Candidatus Pacearchaeota archaeon]
MYDLVPYQFPSVPQPESPETAIARSDAEIAADTLKELSQKALYNNLTASANNLGMKYLDCLKEVDSLKLKDSSNLDVNVEMIKNRGITRMLFGEEERGVHISIRLRKENS